jgi:hypothetical protein
VCCRGGAGCGAPRPIVRPSNMHRCCSSCCCCCLLLLLLLAAAAAAVSRANAWGLHNARQLDAKAASVLHSRECDRAAAAEASPPSPLTLSSLPSLTPPPPCRDPSPFPPPPPAPPPPMPHAYATPPSSPPSPAQMRSPVASRTCCTAPALHPSLRCRFCL